MQTKTFLAVLGLTVGALPGAQATEWVVDPAHTTATFSVKHMMVANVRGEFQKVSGMADIDEKTPLNSKVELTFDVDSLSTHVAKRDTDLKSPMFFDVAKYPQMSFKSTKIVKVATNKYKVTGDLNMHGITKPVTLSVEGPLQPMKSPFGTMVRAVSATGELNRKDWGLEWNKTLETGGVLIGEKIALQVDVELNPKPNPATAADGGPG